MASSQETTQVNDNAVTNGTGTVGLLNQSSVSLASKYGVSSGPEDIEMSEEGLEDSGFDEDNGNPTSYTGSADFILYDGEGTDENQNFLTEDDVVDIASHKANHGSIYRGRNNQTTAQIPRGTSCADQVTGDERTAFYDPIRDTSQKSDSDEEEIRLRYSHSALIPDPMGPTSLQTWTSNLERHESNACRFHRLPNPAQCDQTMGLYEEDIDLEDFQATTFS